MAPKKLVGLSLRWLCSVLRCHRQTCPSYLFEPSNETIPCPTQMCQFDFDMFGDSSEMHLYGDHVFSSHTDACYPERFSDIGGSSERWIGKQSEHNRILKELLQIIEILDQRMELLEHELSQKSIPRLSRLQEIKEKVDIVQKYFC